MTPGDPQPASYKRLIVCADGTMLGSNLGMSWLESLLGHRTWLTKFMDEVNSPSNVARLARSIAKTGIDSNNHLVKQVVLYYPGLGSDSLPITQAIKASIGWGLEQDIAQIYDFIANNYEQGDEIFLFGFSRGAFTVRSLAGLLCDVGVLKSARMTQFPTLWRAYQGNRHGEKFRHSSWYLENHKQLELTDVKIKVVGVWDTVGALGLPEDWRWVKFLQDHCIPINSHHSFHRTTLSKRIDYAYQALALDEKRKTFPPILWHKTDTSPAIELKQCWFPGVHGNIGGEAEILPKHGDYGQIGCISFAWMVDNLSGKLTFDRTAIRLFLDQHKAALYKIGRNPLMYNTNAWGCGEIVDNFAGLPGHFFWLLGSKDRTPSQYRNGSQNGIDDGTNETIHPSARIRRGRVASWKPHSLDGWNLHEHIEGKGWEWTKYGAQPLPEEVLEPKHKMCWSYSALEDDDVPEEAELFGFRLETVKSGMGKNEKGKGGYESHREKDGKSPITATVGPPAVRKPTNEPPTDEPHTDEPKKIQIKFNMEIGSLSRKICPDNILKQLDTGNGVIIQEMSTVSNGTSTPSPKSKSKAKGASKERMDQ